MKKKVKTAVVGTGHLGRHHARIYSELKDSELIGVCDTDPRAGRKVASATGSEYYSDFRDLIGAAEAVSVATPTETHFEVAAALLENGIHVLVEKPITNSPGDAAKLIKIAEKNSSILQVGHIERFNSAVRKAAEYINDPRFIEVNRISRFPQRSLDIGVVLDLMIHDIDIILSFVDSSVKKIESVGAPVFSDKEDIANCRLLFENGCVANITASRISYKSERKFRVFEKDRYISLDYEKQDFVVYKKKKEKINSPGDVKRIKPSFRKKEPLKEELESFLQSIKTKTPPTVSGAHGLSALKLALKITEKI